MTHLHKTHLNTTQLNKTHFNKTHHLNSLAIGLAACGTLFMTSHALGWSDMEPPAAPSSAGLIERAFQMQIQPLLQKYCLRCHNADKMTSGVRVDQLNALLEDRHLLLWQGILKQVEGALMPPEDEPQPTASERQLLAEWIPRAVSLGLSRNTQKNGSARRLTVSQYRNTLRDLLGLKEDLTDVLPPDGLSKEGFANNGQTMLLSPLQVESYFDIAEKALDLCLVDVNAKPTIQNVRLDFGAAINPNPCPDKLILGANSHLLNNQDFLVTELTPAKPFEFTPHRMRTDYRFIEGYQGNATVRGWREFNSIYHAVFACMRGTDGYPRGESYEPVAQGLLLRPAIPSSELFGQSSTYGPMANFKVSLRELPEQGEFRVTVTAAKYNDALLLDRGTTSQVETTAEATISVEPGGEPSTVEIAEAGIYLTDIYFPADESQSKKPPVVTLELGERRFTGSILQPAFLAVRLPAGPLVVAARGRGEVMPQRVVLTRLNQDHEISRRFVAFEERSPQIGVHIGLRRDCGSTLSPVGPPQTVASIEPTAFVFEGAINNYSSPDVETHNVNYLAGIREIGVRCEYTDGRDMPRLLIQSVEFEGPYYSSWPPRTHRNILIDSDRKEDSSAYAGEVIRAFATRAFRRPVTDAEAAALFAVWQRSFTESGDFLQGIKDALLVALTSPQFLFLIENSRSPAPEDVDGYELAAKLSYFLWNTAPDQRLLTLAATNKLRASLDTEVDRMILDPRCHQFVREFSSQWLSLDKIDVVKIDQQRFPKLTRDVKTQLRNEPIYFLEYLLKQNLPLRNVLQSDLILANEVVASYYDLADQTESGFQFVPIRHGSENLGGILSQAGILAGLSDGRESNPIKRGAWLARKIIAEPPEDPPPNVPQLPEDDALHLTLRERLQRHRNQEGCIKCHEGIDPWGIPFETFDAAGRFKSDLRVDARSKLPDATEVADLNELKAYLSGHRIDQVAFSFLKHLSSYALGRSLTYNEIVFLQEKGLELRSAGYRMRDMIRFIVTSEMFLKK